MPIGDIGAQLLLQTLRRIEARGAVETAHRAKQACGQVYRYAIATGRAAADPSSGLTDALKPVNVEHMPAITDPKRVGELLRAIEGYEGMPATRVALQLAPLLFVRPGELRKAEWSEFDLDAGEWRIPAERMKRSKQDKANGVQHLVPLAIQAVAILRDLHPLTGHGRYVFPSARTGERPMSDNAVLAALRRIEARGAIETAHRAKQACGQVFRYAIATGRAEADPSAGLTDALKPVQVEHMPAITDPKRVGELLRAIEAYEGMPATRTALQLAPLLFVRPGELRKAEWSEFDLDAGDWRIPAERMKRSKQDKANGVPHLVPLPAQAVAILRDLHPLTGHGRYVFPSPRTGERPMSDNAVLSALRRMGFPKEEMTGHGFRAMARTMLAERLAVDEAVIEAQLAHTVSGALGRAHNRTQFAAQRGTMMQTWADYLDQLRRGGEVIAFKTA